MVFKAPFGAMHARQLCEIFHKLAIDFRAWGLTIPEFPLGFEGETMAGAGPNSRQLGKYYALAQVGLEMAAPVGLGVWLDQTLGWMPWLTVTGAILGLVGGIAHIVVLSKDDAGPPGDKPA